jgi:hypothetical protein
VVPSPNKVLKASVYFFGPTGAFSGSPLRFDSPDDGFFFPTVSIGTDGAGIIIVVFTVLVALGGGALVYHYTRRITGARRDADRVTAYFREAGIDFSKIVPVERALGDRAPEMYDAEELSIFGSIIVLSILPALLAWLVSMAS